MENTAEQIMVGYADVYEKLYRRTPKDMQALDGGWVTVNGARMPVSELEVLTAALQEEYTQKQNSRNIVVRLIYWFKN